MTDHTMVLSLRELTLSRYDRHMALSFDRDRYILVQKAGIDSYFQEDNNKSVYVSLDHLEKKELVTLIYSKNIKWWSIPKNNEIEHRDISYQLWNGINEWLYRLSIEMLDLLQAHNITQVIWRWSIDIYDIELSEKQECENIFRSFDVKNNTIEVSYLFF